MSSGFSIIENVLLPEECGEICNSLLRGADEKRAGMRSLMHHPVVIEVANDDRLSRIAQEFIGKGAIPFRATLFQKTGRANWLVPWHQDTALPLEKKFHSNEWGPWSIKEGILYAHAPAWALERVIALRIHLDPSTAENGPLRVIPATHESGVLNDYEVIQYAREHGHVNCLVGIGGVIAMRPLLIHASSKINVDLPRRVLHIEYADSLDLTDQIQLALA